ncbi:MAG: MarR family winged helix-turn-helix transcriptional regulator [Mycetocola sp.]
MTSSTPDQILGDATTLISASARFARQAARISAPQRSVVAWRVLATLENDGPQRISDLASRERISQPTMTGVARRLGDDTLVARTADPADGRASLISITPEGSAELALFRQRSAEQLRPALAELSESERHTLRAAAALLDRLSQTLPPPATVPPADPEP